MSLYALLFRLDKTNHIILHILEAVKESLQQQKSYVL
nr:MAG TPA: hypothetical protein [Caudoviricetes sp.]